MKRGLVLAGGGAKGSYQVGVYEALQQLGWQPDVVTGTSVGCLNGALFAQNLLDKARDLWLSLTGAGVMTLPADFSPSQLHEFFRDLVQGGGLDVTPLQDRIDELISEDVLRAAPVRFGLVTVEMNTLKPHELSIDEIPAGQLRDYMLASAACFPAFRPRIIDGVKYIDGGYNDNIPYALAARMGAEELVAVNVYGIGINRPNNTGLPTKMVESRWDLGNILDFDPARAARNIALGRMDCLRAFDKLRGGWYGVEKNENEWVAAFDSAFREHLEALQGSLDAAALQLAIKAALELFRSPDAALAPLELAAREEGVDPAVCYTPTALAAAFAAAYDAKPHTEYDCLFDGNDTGEDVAARLRAAVTPQEYITALCREILKKTDKA